MGKKLARTNQLIDIIKSKNGATVKELAAITGVCEMTIRRDLQFLQENKIVTNVYGSTIYNPSNRIERLFDTYNLDNAVGAHNAEKARIGAFAATLIKNDDSIIIDTGSTTQELAKHVDCSMNLQVLCYNANILNVMLYKKNVSLVVAGGRYHADTQLFESAESLELIKHTRANKAFISAAGVHPTLGITCMNSYEVAAKQAVISSAAECILLADSSKFNIVKPAYFANLSAFKTIITDNALSPSWISQLNEMEITLHLV